MERSERYRPYLRRAARDALVLRHRAESGRSRFAALRHDAPRGLRWFVVQTRAREERVAAGQLQRLELPVFLPCRLQTIRHARRLHTEIAPLFPGYLFVKFDASRRGWSDIAATQGVKQILTSGGRPNPVAAGVVETLLASSDDRGIVYFRADIATGGNVRLLSGPFASELGVLERLDNAGRVSLLLDIMNRKVRVSMDRDNIALY